MAFPRVENAPKAKIYGSWSTGAAAAPLREPRSGEKRRQRAGMRSMGGKDAEPAGGSGAHLPALGQGRRPAPKMVGIGVVGAQRGPREHQKMAKKGPWRPACSSYGREVAGKHGEAGKIGKMH